MSDNVYRVIELVGSSTDSVEDAIENALSRAGSTLRNLDWFQVIETRGMIADDKRVGYYQVVLKVGFTVEDERAFA